MSKEEALKAWKRARHYLARHTGIDPSQFEGQGWIQTKDGIWYKKSEDRKRKILIFKDKVRIIL